MEKKLNKKSKKTALGSGIGALIPDVLNKNNSYATDVFFGSNAGNKKEKLSKNIVNMCVLEIDTIVSNQKQPRKDFEKAPFEELVSSIKENGVLQPIVVREIPQKNKKQYPKEKKYELVMGERRFRASKEAGLSTIPAVITITNDNQMLKNALIENIHRSNLNPIEEAFAFKQLLEDFSCTQEELSEKITCSRVKIANTIRLLRLPEVVQKMIISRELNQGQVRPLLVIDDKEQIEKLAKKIKKDQLSARAVENLVLSIKKNKKRSNDPETKKITNNKQIKNASEKISKILKTNAKITLGKQGNKILIPFKDLKHLDFIVSKINEA